MKKTFQFICVMLMILGCQESDDINPDNLPNEGQEDPSQEIPSLDIPSMVTVISETDDAIYQIDVQTDDESLKEYNLTEDIGALPTYYSRYINGSQLSFVYKEAQEVTTIFKDVAKQNTQTHDLTSKLDDPFSGVNYGNAVEDYLILFNRSGPNYDDLSVFGLNVNTGNTGKITFGKGTSYSSRILYDDDWLVLKYTDLNGDDILASVNLVTGEVNSKVFNSTYFAILNEGQIYVFYCNSKYYEIYDVTDLTLVDTVDLDVCGNIRDWNINTGLNKAQVDGDNLLVQILYPQPNPDGHSPGVYDLNTGEMIQDKMIVSSIRRELETSYNAYIKINTYEVDLSRNHIVLGYEKDDGFGNLSGGLIFTDFTGEIIKEIILNRPPQEIIITKS